MSASARLPAGAALVARQLAVHDGDSAYKQLWPNNCSAQRKLDLLAFGLPLANCNYHKQLSFPVRPQQ
jgi:hypothetical protein